MTKVYHWTTHDNAQEIIANGLKKDSYVCRNSDDWDGEICLVIDTGNEFDWSKREEPFDWQARTDFVPREFIRVLVKG